MLRLPTLDEELYPVGVYNKEQKKNPNKLCDCRQRKGLIMSKNLKDYSLDDAKAHADNDDQDTCKRSLNTGHKLSKNCQTRICKKQQEDFKDYFPLKHNVTRGRGHPWQDKMNSSNMSDTKSNRSFPSCLLPLYHNESRNHLIRENVFLLKVHLHACQTQFLMSEGFCIRTRLESDAQGNSETAYCFGFNKSIEA